MSIKQAADAFVKLAQQLEDTQGLMIVEDIAIVRAPRLDAKDLRPLIKELSYMYEYEREERSERLELWKSQLKEKVIVVSTPQGNNELYWRYKRLTSIHNGKRVWKKRL